MTTKAAAMATAQNPIHVDPTQDELIEFALAREEGRLASNGALAVETGARTGRSPKDRYIVQDKTTSDTVDWGIVNRPIETDQFTQLWTKVNQFLNKKEHFISHLQVGADENDHVKVKVMTELAWHHLFTQNLFIKPKRSIAGQTDWTLMCAPNYKADPAVDGTHSEAAIMINFTEKKVLVCGTHYAGEMKKSMFSVLNYMCPEHDILPMHCAANMGENEDVALFFGLSGTGKTTLSADPKRFLIGDDEHGWSRDAVFNFEGGCYAKCIDLSQEKEPVIWDAIRRGSIMENVVLDPNTLIPDYSDGSLTQNTRAGYPRKHIPLRVEANQAGTPNAVIFLTCDLYGVLPPVSVLSKEQAAYHFLSGYTALVGSTEVGQTASIQSTFSTCFGAPFFPRPPAVYAKLLMKRMEETGANVYLVNTGWTGGDYSNGGKRFSIPTTRAIIDAILSGEINNCELETLPGFNFSVPKALRHVDANVLNPKNAWSDANAFDEKRQTLMDLFKENFKKFDVDQSIVDAGPQ